MQVCGSAVTVLKCCSLTFKTPTKNYFFKAFLLITYIYIIFLRLNVIKKSQNTRNQGFSSYFFLMIKGSRSVPMNNGSGSKWPKNTWIQNTGLLNGKGKGASPGWNIVFNPPDHLVLAKRRKNHWTLNHLIILRCPTLSVGGGGLQVFDTKNS
jgi:hypothetical protein